MSLNPSRMSIDSTLAMNSYVLGNSVLEFVLNPALRGMVHNNPQLFLSDKVMAPMILDLEILLMLDSHVQKNDLKETFKFLVNLF